MVPESYHRVWRRRLRRRPLLPWLVAGTLAGDLLFFFLVVAAGNAPYEYFPPPIDELISACYFGGCFAQLALLAVWLVSGRAGLLTRLLVVCLGCCLIGPLISDDGNLGDSITFCLGAFAYCVAAALLGVLSERFRVARQDSPETVALVIHLLRSPRLAPSLWRGGRWGISALLTVTTIFAVTAAAIASVGSDQYTSQLFDRFIAVLMLSTAAITVLIHQAAKRAMRIRTVAAWAVTAWFAGTFLVWLGDFDMGLRFSAGYSFGVAAVALVWCAGLRGRRPASAVV